MDQQITTVRDCSAHCFMQLKCTARSIQNSIGGIRPIRDIVRSELLATSSRPHLQTTMVPRGVRLPTNRRVLFIYCSGGG